jgi:hypothetical protein
VRAESVDGGLVRRHLAGQAQEVGQALYVGFCDPAGRGSG